MGIRSHPTEDTESTLVPEEKGAGGGCKQPPSDYLRLLLRGALARWALRGPRQRLEDRRIEGLRRSIGRDRGRVRSCMDGWDLHRRTWQLRAEAWARGGDISAEQRRAGGFAYSTRYRYDVTVEGGPASGAGPGPGAGVRAVILDFRTPEGREEALRWHESRYLACTRDGNMFLGYYKCWEEDYQDYVYTRKKSRGWADQASLRGTLLRGVPQVYWVKTKARRRPD